MVPRKQLELLLLAALAHGPEHGYAIIAAIRERSDGRFDLLEGTVYPALHRLEEAGLIKSKWAVVDRRRRRLYQLTARGTKALAKEQQDWTAFASSIEQVIRWQP